MLVSVKGGGGCLTYVVLAVLQVALDCLSSVCSNEGVNTCSHLRCAGNPTVTDPDREGDIEREREREAQE